MQSLKVPIFKGETKENLLLKYTYQLKINDILAGTVVGREKKQNLVFLGLPQVSCLPISEIYTSSFLGSKKALKKHKVREFVLIFYQGQKTILSFRRLHYEKLWRRFKQIDYPQTILYVFLKKSILGAKILNLDGLSLYVPNTHLPKYYRRLKNQKKQIQVSLLEVKRKKHTIVGSTKLALLKKQRPTLHLGLCQVGVVLHVKSFGLFLNIYGMKSLLHISEISTKKISNLDNLYRKGDKILVKLIYVNESQGKIAVSAKF